MDDKGLELSLGLGLGLGLPCGGSSSNPKDGSNNPSSSAPRTDTDERTSKILNDFRNFLNPTIPPQSFQAKPPTNFPQPATSGNGSGGNNNSGKLSADNNNRKNPFAETNNNNNNNPKKLKTDNSAHSSDHVQEKNVITSHISITTDEGSTADNEDVAESEADQGSTSQLASHKEEVPHVGPEIQGKMNIGAKSFRAQSLNKLSIPHSISFKGTTPVGTPSSSSYHPVSNMIPGMGMHPMTFGYSSIQIPVLNGDTTTTTQGGGIGHPQIQSLHSPYGAAGRGGISTSDQTRGQTKQPIAPEEGSSSQTEEDTKDRASSNTFPSDYPTIKPGILADIKFGGSGTFPNLPWVSTTGPGPNGKTISGVTYKYNSTQIRIVCACHGTHMSPDEFIRHASASENEPSTPRLASISNTSPAASAAKS